MQWKHLGLISYGEALAIQEDLRDRLINGSEEMFILTLEHRGVITMGRTASRDEVFLSDDELLDRGLELFQTSRGGKCTCHVPGQLVCYPILNINKMKLGVDELVHALEEAMVLYLKGQGISAARDRRNPGVWFGDKKIGYIGLNIHRGITTHGFSLNICPDLSAFSYFVPCGMDNCGCASVETVIGHCQSMYDAAREVAAILGGLLAVEINGCGHT